MKALVTGADGFVGRWLVRHLQERGDEVVSLAGTRTDRSRASVDVRDRSSVGAVIDEARPEAVYHLAAIAFGPEASQDIEQAVAVTVIGTANVLEASRRLPSPPIVLIPSSGEVYAPAPDRPLTESDVVLPANPYGATKIGQEAVALAYDRSGAVPAVIARAFNQIGPGQRPAFVLPALASQLARISTGQVPPVLKVGNLASVRDFTDVRDVVRAYRFLVTGRHTGQPVNVASGAGISVSDLLDRLIEISGTRVKVEVEPSRLRPADVSRIVGSPSLLRRLTGWRPEIDLDTSLRDVWADAVERFGSGGS